MRSIKSSLVLAASFLLLSCSGMGNSVGLSSTLESSQFMIASSSYGLALYTVDPSSKALTLRDEAYGDYERMAVHPSKKWIVASMFGGWEQNTFSILKVDKAEADLEIHLSAFFEDAAAPAITEIKFHPSGNGFYVLTNSCSIYWAKFNETTGLLDNDSTLSLDGAPNGWCESMDFELDGTKLWVTSIDSTYIVETGDGSASPSLLLQNITPGINTGLSRLPSGKFVGITSGNASPENLFVICSRNVSHQVNCVQTFEGTNPIAGVADIYVLAHPTLEKFVAPTTGSAHLMTGSYDSTEIFLNPIALPTSHVGGKPAFNTAGSYLAVPRASSGGATSKFVDFFNVNTSGDLTFDFSAPITDSTLEVILF